MYRKRPKDILPLSGKDTNEKIVMYSDYKKRITMVDNSMANIRDAVGWRWRENEV